jgi:ABC-2 type transport system permease protein
VTGRLAARQVFWEQRLFWRNRQAAIFTFVLPVGLLAFGALGRHSDVDGHPYTYLFVPGLIGTAIVFTTFAGIAITLVVRRDSGILKRVRGTPLPPAVYLGALAGSMALVLALEAVIIVLVGSTLLDLKAPDSPLELLGLVVLGAFAFAALAFAIVPLVPAAEGSSAVISSIYLPLLGLSGAFFPLHRLPVALRELAEVLPLSHLLSGLRAAYAGGGLTGRDAAGLLVTVAWALAGALVAVRRFGWEPRGGS